MDGWATLEPTRLYDSATPHATSPSGSRSTNKIKTQQAFVGRLPIDIHLLILEYLPLPDIPSYARCARSTAGFARGENFWEAKYRILLGDANAEEFSYLLDSLEPKKDESKPALIAAESLDDEFGEFATVSTSVSYALPSPAVIPTNSHRGRFIRAYSLLKPLTNVLSLPPHQVLSSLPQMTPLNQALLLSTMSRFLSSSLQPLRSWKTLAGSLRAAIDRFDATLLAAFDSADTGGDEEAMRTAASASWAVWTGAGADWEMGKVWAEKREVFYEQGRWESKDNLKDGVLNFDAMDEFMNAILGAIQEHGSLAVRIFPLAANVFHAFATRLANEVVGEYITPLLSHARSVSNAAYLTATAAAFREAWRMVAAVTTVGKGQITQTQAEDIVYQMFEINMDEYLDEEIDLLKVTFDNIVRTHEKNSYRDPNTPSATSFVASQNPALVKRNVLASFTDVLLLPVTIVPRGIAMLNPQRWTANAREEETYAPTPMDGKAVFEITAEVEDDFDDLTTPKRFSKGSEKEAVTESARQSIDSAKQQQQQQENSLSFLLSLDVVLELIHADRDALKRSETFAGYPGHYGHRVKDTIQELAVLLLQALGEQHVTPGFAQALDQMANYKPETEVNLEDGGNLDGSFVAPLVNFFELVHMGDTIQSMVQVYYDRELVAPGHVDNNDFLDPVVREKKRFENALDDSVAAGLNAGTDVLMNQVEHIIITLTPPRAYYPPEDAPLELGPTRGCTAAIACLETHCRLVRGSTNREVLEVFYQEIGIRLIGILQKHIKRQIISLSGGFQVIADLNAYHAFIASLKVPSLTTDFSNLKMLGHVYVVEDAKDLAQIVRDVTRYGGAYRPEDIYEFIQRRSDWKKIEKTVDKTMYNLSFKEDCIIS